MEQLGLPDREIFKPKSDFRTPPGARSFAMGLFLVALGMLFAATILGYSIIRWQRTEHFPELHLSIPIPLWFSTLLLFGSSITLHRALRAVQRERQIRFRWLLTATMILGYLFLWLQWPAMEQLLLQHVDYSVNQIHLYGLMVVLIGLHALHVLCGIVPLTLVTYRAWRHQYDHEFYTDVFLMAMYWHFLDGVWTIMFLTFLILG